MIMTVAGWLAFIGAFIIWVVNFFDDDYAEAYMNWLKFKDPLGTRLWRDHTWRHIRPVVFALVILALGSSIDALFG